MNRSKVFVRLISSSGMILLVCALNQRGVGSDADGLPGRAREVRPVVPAGATPTPSRASWGPWDILKTNTVERTITNVIRVSMPSNRFVYEYHTNWIPQYTTNVVDIYRTDWIDQFRTNVVTVHRTNWVDEYRTNVVNAYRTNFVTRTLTNEQVLNRIWTNQVTTYLTNPVTLFLTNRVSVYQTNWQTLNLTNWETVVLFKTNSVRQLFTNAVELEATTNRAVTEKRPEVKPERSLRVSEPQPAGTRDVLVLAAFKSSPTATGDWTEVKLQVSLADDPDANLQVERWVVEREDKPMAFSGRDREFTQELPAGKYKVAVEARRDVNQPSLYARTKFEVTPQAVILQK